jgi:MFS family permease
MAMTFLPLAALFCSCFILMMGNGLINVFLPVKMAAENLNTGTIGLVLSLYYVGMLIGAIYSKNLIKRAGHVRVFAGCVALGAVSVLACSFYEDKILWGLMRVVIGFCNACAYTAMESWLSGSATKNSRGKVLAAYNAVVLGGLFTGQFLLNYAPPSENTLFVLGGALLCCSIIPVALSKNSGPVIEDVIPMSIVALLKKSPLGVVCCITGGLVYAALFNMLPVFAKANNIVDFQLTLYMAVAIFGAFILQFPVGYLSDKYDRRTIIFILLFCSAIFGVIATIVAQMDVTWPLFIATSITTGIIACIYPLSISEVFDRLRQNEMVAAMGSMILAFSLGGVLGPYTASVVMDLFGNNSLFYFLAIVQLLLAGFVMYRKSVRESLPVDKQESFVMQSAAMTAMVDLDPRTEYIEPTRVLSSDAQTAIDIAHTDQGAAVKMVRAIAVSHPDRAVEMACALASVEDIDVLRLYEVMREAVPDQIMAITRAIVATQPDLAYNLVKRLAEHYPEQVVSVAAEIGFASPELRVDMARIAVESAPESVLEVAEYYAQVMAQEREDLRPADEAEDTSEQDALDIAAQLWEASPEQALDVAVTLAEAVPETVVSFATELAENISDTDIELDEDRKEVDSEDADAVDQAYLEKVYQEAIETDAAIDLVHRFSEVAPDSALEVAAAVVEAVPDSAGSIASEFISNMNDEEYVKGDGTALEESASRLEYAHQAALNTEIAIDLVQTLSDAAPENTSDVAAAVVDAFPDSASLLLDNISEGAQSIEGEWVSMLDDAPKEIANLEWEADQSTQKNTKE